MTTGKLRGYRLSPQQQQLLQGVEDPSHLRVGCAIHLRGPLRHRRLKEALGRLVERHETLRTTFPSRPHARWPVQAVMPAHEAWSWCLVDVTSPPDPIRLLGRLATAGDLSQPPVLRAVLVRRGAEDHLLLLSLPGLCADAGSLSRLVTALAAEYATAGEPAPGGSEVAGGSGRGGTDGPALQYTQFAEWSHKRRRQECDNAEGVSFWRRQEVAAASSPGLPFELPAEGQTGASRGRGGLRQIRLALSASEAAAVAAAARDAEAHLDHFLLACWLILLARLGGRWDVGLELLDDGRRLPPLESALGLFARPLPLGLRIDRRKPLRSALRSCREGALAARKWQDSLPVPEPDEADATRAEVAAPVAFELVALPEPAEAGGVDFTLVAQEASLYPTRLGLRALAAEGRLELELAYHPARFRGGDLQRVLGHLRTLTLAAARAPGTPVGELPLLSAAERAWLLTGVNDTGRPFPPSQRVHTLFARHAARRPGDEALVFEDRRLTYGELEAAANRLAHLLRRRGAGPEVRVALALDRGAEIVIALLAVLKAGAAYVVLDLDQPRERMGHVLRGSGAGLLVTSSSMEPALPAHGLETVRLDRGSPPAGDLPRDDPGVEVAPENLAYVVFTSGSTGTPKGVAVEHRQLANYVQGILRRLELPAGATYANVSTFAADLGNTATFAALCGGGTLHVLARERLLDGDAMGRYFERQGIDCLKIVPSHLEALQRTTDPRRLLPRRCLVVGGEASRSEWIAEMASWGGDCTLLNHYGPSEATVGVSTHRAHGEAMDPRWGSLPIGRPLANSRLYLLDGELEPVPLWVAGELLIGGAGVTRGYLGGPGATALAFIPDPVGGEPGERLYRTGDLARRLPGGAVEFLGRADHQVKIRGFRVELGEVEAVLAAHPEVAHAVVMARRDQPGEVRLAAYLVPLADAQLEVESLQGWLAERLPEPMRPTAFVTLPELPLTRNGKVDRAALPVPEDDTAGHEVAPRTPLEEEVAALFGQVLGVSRVGADSHFFHLGGHSLLAARLVARLRQTFEVELPLASVFDSPTVAAVAAAVEAQVRRGQKPPAPPMEPVDRGADLPLSFAQQRLWFLAELEPDSAFYNSPRAVHLDRPLEAGALARALDEVARRHEVLRTTFPAVDGEPVQRILPAGARALPVVDLSGLPPGRRLEASRELIRREAGRPFVLSDQPPLRRALLRRDAADHVLLLTLHHIASDAWSVAVLVRELEALYEAYAGGLPSPLPELPVQYADYAAWQRHWLSGEVLAAELEHWRHRLDGAPRVLELPTDRPRPPFQSYRGAALPVELEDDLSAGLAELGRRSGATLYMVLLALFKALLYRHSGSEDLCVGTPVANRNRTEIEGLIGFFTNTLVLRTDLGGEPAFSELVARVRRVALDAFAHQELPFEKLVEEIQPERSLAHSPLFQVMFVFHRVAAETLAAQRGGARALATGRGTSKFDLLLGLAEADGRLYGELEINLDLFDPTTGQRLLNHFLTLARGAVASPEAPLAGLPLLPAAERHQVTGEWAGSVGAAAPPAPAAHRAFTTAALAAPDAVALAMGDEAWTYAHLQRRALAVAHRLRRLGVGPDVPVGLCAHRSPTMMLGVLGILLAGGAYVPLDPEYPGERLALMVEDAGISVLAGQAETLAHLPPAIGATLEAVVNLEETLEPAPRGAAPLPPSSADLLAYVIYTSGSTGRPKGVAMRHGALAQLLAWQQSVLPAAAGVRTLQFASLSFDVSFQETFSTWGAAGTLILVSAATRRDPQALLALLHRRSVERLFLPFVALDWLAEEASREGLFPGALTEIVTAGEQLRVTSRIRALLAHLPGCRLHNHYGPSETHVVTAWSGGEGAALPTLPPIGRPVDGTRVHLQGPGGAPAPVGVPGELFLGGLCLARGYLGRPALTAERFVPAAAGRGRRHYRTGDLARWLADGELEFLGRRDQQVKVRGFRIEPGEVETALEEHPAVAEAVVVAREDGGPRRLVAYAVIPPGDAGGEPRGPELRSFLEDRLPPHMVPAVFVSLEALPLTPSGKIDRRALPAPEAPAAAPTGDGPRERDQVEEVLAAVWGEVLGVAPPGPEDDFFALGGHSLLATQVASRLERAFRVQLPLRALFEEPTLGGLARRLRGALAAGGRTAAPPLEPASRRGPLPLSFAQQRLWFLHQLAPGSPAYNLPLALELRGSLRPSALAASLSRVVRRHEILRTTYPAPEGEPVQAVASPAPVPLPLVDLSGLSAPRRSEICRDLATTEVRRPFALEREPPLRLLLLRTGEQEHLLAGTVHHIAADGWSLAVLTRELIQLYTAACGGEAPSLPDLPVQYGDFASWQRHLHGGDGLAAERAYWRRRLGDSPPLLDLPTDRPRLAVQSFRGATLPFTLPRELTRDLISLSRRRGVTLFMTLLAAFKVLLHRYSRQRVVSVGSPFAGRTRVETENLIGLFVNTLVLRTHMGGDPAFGDLLVRVRETVLEAHAHQDLPFEKLVEELAPERSLAHMPLFQVMFILQNNPAALFEAPDLTLEPVAPETGVARFDLTLALSETADGLAGTVGYDRDLFDPTTVRRLVGHLQRVLEAAVAGPDTRLWELTLLAAAERHALVVDPPVARAPASSHVAMGTLPELFAHQARRAPEAVAVSWGAERWSFQELARRGQSLARRLHRRGMGPETVVAVLLERSPQMLAAILGVAAAGGAYLPLDPSHPRRRLAFQLADAGAAAVLTTAALAPRLPEDAPSQLILDPLTDAPAADPAQAREKRGDPGAPDGDQLAYVLYTSGSTGRPKGVMVSHAGLAHYLRWCLAAYCLGGGRGAPVHSPLGFDLTVTSLLAPLVAGRGVTLVGEGSGPAALAELLRRGGGYSLLKLTPSHLEVLRRELTPEAAREAADALVLGGEALLWDEALTWWRRVAPAVRLINEYGPTEAVVGCAVYELPAHPPAAGAPVPIGRPLPGTRLQVLDPFLRPAPMGVPGEISIGGPGLARGYRGHPALTAERFVPHPTAGSPGERLYRSGDRARRRSDGQLEFLGRLDQQVKIRGFRVEPDEIAAVLSEHPAVEAAVVTVWEAAPGDRRLVAYVVPGSAEAGESRLRESLEQRLPAYMVPTLFVPLEELPLTANGKVDHQALPPPLPEGRGDGGDFEAPEGHVEATLAAIWEEVLQRPGVGRGDHFFALGGHSLLATQVLARLGRSLGVQLPLRSLFEAPVLRQLAAQVEAALRRADGPRDPEIEAVPRDGGLPLSFAQQRLWFLDRLQPGTATYNVPLALRLRGRLEPAALARGITEVVRRHEILRTRFRLAADEPVQVVDPPAPLPLPVIELAALTPGDRRRALGRVAAREAARPFDLGRGPILRVRLLRLGGGDHALLATVHHIASDAWSRGLLVREVATLYTAFLRGRPSPLPPLPIQVADYAAWQRRWLTGEVLEAEIEHWRQRLAGAPPVLELPTDRPRPAVMSYRGAVVPVELPRRLHARLEDLGRSAGATLFLTLFAGFVALLHRWTGETDLSVGTPVSGRNRTEVEGLIGLFLNTLVLRSDLAGDPSFSALLGHARETLLEAHQHQELPFEKLVEELDPDRDRSASPLFQVFFTLQSAARDAVELAGIEVDPLEVETGTAKFDLTLSLSASADRLAGFVEYSTDLFDAVTVRRLAHHFERLLEAAASDPEQHLSELRLLGSSERFQLLTEWNDTAVPYPRHQAVYELVSRQGERTPEAVAVSSESEHLSYGEMLRRSRLLARRLQELGVAPEVLVGLYLERSAELPVAVLGVMAAGGAYLPLDPTYPTGRLSFIAADAGAAVVLTQRPLRAQLPATLARDSAVLTMEDALEAKADRAAEASGPSPAPEAPAPRSPQPQQLAYVLYTSGSTGRPKGVAIPHRALVNFLWGMRRGLGLSAPHNLLAVTSLSFDISALELYVPLLAGGRVEVARRPTVADGRRLAARLATAGTTVMQATPSGWRMLLDAGWTGDPALLALCGGEALPRDLAGRLSGGCLGLWNLYGPTETTVWSAARCLAAGEAGSVPLGRPIANTQIHLLDPVLEPVAPGAAGELWIGGDGLARGYLGRAGLTAERFRPDPFGAPGRRLYRTGDLARRRGDGELEYLGRLDHQVKIRGHRIELGEIEAALLSHPALRRAAVVARDDVPGDVRLVAYVVPADGEAPAAGELRHHLEESLPAYMVPSAFVFLTELPLTPNRKVDRRALPAPEGRGDAAERPYVAPRNEVEERLAEIWQEVLGLEAVGAEDDFFELGGHSMLAVRMLARVSRTFDHELPLAALFEGSTVAHLAALLQHSQPPTGRVPLVRIREGGPGRPLFLVHPVGGDVLCYVELARRLDGSQPVFGLQSPEAGDGRPETVAELAEVYLQAIEEVQPEGPYRLAGWSMGGLVAYEMAQRLLAGGREVELLALFEAAAPGDGRYPEALDEVALTSGFARDLGGLFGRELHLAPEELRPLPAAERLDRVVEAARELEVLPPEIDAERVRRHFEMFKRNHRAMLAYDAPPYPGRLLLFTTAATGDRNQEDPTLGWGALVAGGVALHTVPGDHYDMVRPPHVEVPAAVMRAELAALDGESAAEPASARTAGHGGDP